MNQKQRTEVRAVKFALKRLRGRLNKLIAAGVMFGVTDAHSDVDCQAGRYAERRCRRAQARCLEHVGTARQRALAAKTAKTPSFVASDGTHVADAVQAFVRGTSDAVKAFVRGTSACAQPEEVEGDRQGWHIRLMQRVVLPMMTIETWSLYHGDVMESSPTTKDAVRCWRDEEIAKRK